MTTAVLVPGSPLLLPGVGGRADPARELREHAVAAIKTVINPAMNTGPGSPTRLELIVAGPVAGPLSPTPYPLRRLIGTGTGFGPGTGTDDHRTDRPIALLGAAVGLSLIDAAGWTDPVDVRSAIAADHDPTPLPAAGADVLIMVGDGSALRRDGGPDVPREEAIAFDDRLLELITAGDPAGLARLCRDTAASAEELLITGIPVWQQLAALASASRTSAGVQAAVDYADDPFGVFTLIASWRW